MRFEYKPTRRAVATSSARSFRCNGSPPEKPTCRAPSSAASFNTRSQSAVESSLAADASCVGLEQYGQCNGQRCVNSASKLNGRGMVRAMLTAIARNDLDNISRTQPIEVSVHLIRDLCRRRRITRGQLAHDLLKRLLAIAPRDDGVAAWIQ